MKKIIIGLLLALSSSSFAAPMSSTINLPVPDQGSVAPHGGEISIPLSGYLIDDVRYDVTCHVYNGNGADGLIIKVSKINTYCPTMGGCGGITVNGSFPGSNQVNLTQSDNAILYMGVMTQKYDPKGALIFQNLDNDRAAIVSQCVAKPSVN